MKRTVLSAAFLFSCLLGACSSEKDVTCDVMWSASDDTELGSATIVYEGLDDVDMGLEMCQEEQEDHGDRPADTMKYSCDCST